MPSQYQGIAGRKTRPRNSQVLTRNPPSSPPRLTQTASQRQSSAEVRLARPPTASQPHNGRERDFLLPTTKTSARVALRPSGYHRWAWGDFSYFAALLGAAGTGTNSLINLPDCGSFRRTMPSKPPVATTWPLGLNTAV